MFVHFFPYSLILSIFVFYFTFLLMVAYLSSLFCRSIIEQEGPKALFRGLGPNLVGVAPSRAIYFCAYSQTKKYLNTYLPTDTAGVHIISASVAGKIFVTFILRLGYTHYFS